MSKDSKLRSVNTKFWDDSYVINLDPIEKLLFLYFLTNPLTNLSGIYEIALRRIAFDTGIDKEMVAKILERLEKDKKIYYRGGYIILANFYKNQNYNPSMLKNAENFIKILPKEINSFINTLKDQPVYTLYTTYGQEEGEGEGEDEDEKEVERLTFYWNSALTTPKLLEKELIEELFKKFGFKKTKYIIRQFAEGNFRSIKTMREALNEDGSIKPKNNNNTSEEKPFYETDPDAWQKKKK